MKEALVTIAIAVLAVGLLFGAAVVKWSWSANTDTDEVLGPLESRPVVPYTPMLESDRFHGVAMQIHNRAMLKDFERATLEIADLGADTVEFSLAAYQENGSSSTIAAGAHSAPTPEELGELIRTAKTRSMRVIVLPIVLLDHPRGSEWRGKIVPTDPDRWWADYREYIRRYAGEAEKAGADLFMVGSELNRMESSTGRWRTLIKFLHHNYPKLKLGYSANWDRYWKVAYWNESKPGAGDGLDFAGVTSYYELAPEPESKNPKIPTVDEIVAAWKEFGGQHYRDRLIEWQRTIGKPVVFTEVGYFSQVGTANAPWNYCLEGPPSQEEQANCYKAFLKVWTDRTASGDGVARRSPWDMLGGTIFWEWTQAEVKADDESYTPKSKLGEKVIRDYFQSVGTSPRQPREATTKPAGPTTRAEAATRD